VKKKELYNETGKGPNMKSASPKELEKEFKHILLDWNSRENDRSMPWKGEKDPYRIWLSEIILQQTRVDQGLRYYHSFINKYPDIHALANASPAEVLKLWEGLGYYSRCRNLHETARHISGSLQGKFPGSYEGIRTLKGVGPYTAAAICSFAFNLPHAVVDGNVFRVLSRIFGIYTAIDTTAGRNQFNGLANELLDRSNPGVYNQAIMDFGAVICKPQLPLCEHCPFIKVCSAYQTNRINDLPVREKKISVRKRWFYYLQLEKEDRVFIRQRTNRDIWKDLYEFPLVETQKESGRNAVIRLAEKSALLPEEYSVISISSPFSQQLSHQLISGRFLKIKVATTPPDTQGIWIKKEELKKYPFPQFIHQHLQKSILA
jgi:A/G-specific adenine glycosylase